MVTHLRTLSYLTSVIWPFTHTAFTFGSCLCGANLSHLRDRWTVNIVKNINPQMVTHLSIVHGFSCLTSAIWPFTLTALTFGSCWFGIVSHFKDGWALNFFHKLKCLNVWNLHNALVSDKTFLIDVKQLYSP